MAIAQETRICANCRAETNSTSRFCHNCGADLEAVGGPPTYQGAPIPGGGAERSPAPIAPTPMPIGNYPQAPVGWGVPPPKVQLPEVLVPSGYVARKLMPGEHVYYYGRASFMRIVDIVLVIVLGPVLLAFYAVVFSSVPYLPILIPVLVLALLINIIGSFVSLLMSELALTDKRVLGRWGRLLQKEIDIPLDWLMDVYGKGGTFSESYGLLYIATNRKSGFRILDSVRNPVVFASLASALFSPNKTEYIKKKLARQQAILWGFVAFIVLLGVAAVFLAYNYIK